MSWNNK